MTGAVAGMQDAWVTARRGLLRVRRTPRLLTLPALQPVLFVLLFGYVLGGAVTVPGVPYVEFLIPGVLVQAVAFTAGAAAVGVAADVRRGMVDRFRTLPVSGAATLFGRTAADLVRIAVTVAVAVACGVVAGWRIHTGPAAAAAGFALLLIFGYAVAWLAVLVGLSTGTVPAARRLITAILVPLTFVSCALAPTAAMPPWLRPVAEANPVSAVVAALRGLWGNEPADAAAAPPAAYPLMVLAWTLAVLLAAVLLALRAHRRATPR